MKPRVLIGYSCCPLTREAFERGGQEVSVMKLEFALIGALMALAFVTGLAALVG